MTRSQSNLINLDFQSMFKKKNILTYMMIISIVILSGCDSDRFTADYGWASPILVEESVISMSEKGMVFVADGWATFSATGVGVNTEDGGSAWKGSSYFETSAPSLSELNGKCIVFYWNVDPEGTATWELHDFS